jgi:hypothetical protein
MPFVMVWQIAKDYLDRSNELVELFPDAQGVPIEADKFIIQADRLGVEFPDDLVAEVAKVRPDSVHLLHEIRKRNAPAQSAQMLHDLKMLERENRRLQKVIKDGTTGNSKVALSQMTMDYALALKFKFKLDGRSSAVTNIVGLLERANVKIHPDTVRDRLQAAVAHFGPILSDE